MQIHEEMLARLREVEQEFELKKVPFYKARGEVIKSIPGFWLHCFLQHQEVKSVIGEVDEQVLRSLVEVSSCPASLNQLFGISWTLQCTASVTVQVWSLGWRFWMPDAICILNCI